MSSFVSMQPQGEIAAHPQGAPNEQRQFTEGENPPLSPFSKGGRRNGYRIFGIKRCGRKVLSWGI
jgi:hypothetical protein